MPSAGKSSATAAAAATPATSLTCAASGVASSVAPQEAVPTVRSVCLRAPALALCCSLRQALLTPANGRSPLEAARPQTGTSACHTKASAPAAMHSPAALSKRPCWPACATAHAPRPTPRATRWPRSRRQDRRGQIKNLPSVHVRPPKVHERQRPGHREGDLEGDRIEGARSARAIGAWVGRATPWVLCWLSCCAPTRPQLCAASLRRQAAWPLQ